MVCDDQSRIRKLRDGKGYTLEKLAELTDSSKSYIWELENKAPRRPSAEKLSKIAKVLGVTIEYLIGNDERMSQESSEDAHFYRNYREMDEKTKRTLRSVAKLLSDDDVKLYQIRRKTLKQALKQGR